VNITIARNDQQYGPYTLDQINLYLALGHLSGADLAWHEGATQWAQLSTLPGVVLPPPRLAAVPVAKRSVGKLVLMALVWLAAFWLGSLFLAGLIAGFLNPHDAGHAGRAAGELLCRPFLLISLVASILLTVAGKLPGTGKGPIA
jgi:hypothetical protein